MRADQWSHILNGWQKSFWKESSVLILSSTSFSSISFDRKLALCLKESGIILLFAELLIWRECSHKLRVSQVTIYTDWSISDYYAHLADSTTPVFAFTVYKYLYPKNLTKKFILPIKSWLLLSIFRLLSGEQDLQSL